MLVTSQYQPRLSNIKCNQFSPGGSANQMAVFTSNCIIYFYTYQVNLDVLVLQQCHRHNINQQHFSLIYPVFLNMKKIKIMITKVTKLTGKVFLIILFKLCLICIFEFRFQWMGVIHSNFLLWPPSSLGRKGKQQ